MNTPYINRLLNAPQWLACFCALLAGSLIPLSFAPFNVWPVGILSLTLLAIALNQQSQKAVLWRTWFFGAGMFGTGISWIYVSIHGFGGAPAPLAIMLVSIFVGFMAGIFAAPFYIYGRWFSRHKLGLLVVFPLIWLLNEWLRTWLFTGFPWLFIGYAHIDTWLSGWAPLTGVIGISLICALSAGVIAHLILHPRASRELSIAAFASCVMWATGFGLQHIEWTQQSSESMSVAIVQPNIAQADKWQEDYQEPTLDLLKHLTEPLWDHDIIIWPEAAIPLMYSDALPFLNDINQKASGHHAGLITGIIYDEPANQRYYNSVATFGNAIGIYHKRRLVPFGEYVPLGEWLRGIIDFFNLPTSIINLGPQDQHGLKVGDTFISPSVCYEIAFPDLVANSAIGSQLLMSVSNLGWFGDSLGRHQFMEMAQMRAIETQRYFIYSTNNGPSAVFDRSGKIQIETKAFEQAALSTQVYPANGTTPFMHWGSLPLVVISMITLTGLWFFARRKKHKKGTGDN